MKELSGSPPAVVPPPTRINVPLASRNRRRDGRSVVPSADISLISDSGESWGLQLTNGKCGESCGDLSGNRALVVQPTGLDHCIEMLDHDSPTVYRSARSRDLLVLSRHVVICRENDDSAAYVTHPVLNLPFLGRHNDDSVLGNSI